MTGLHANRPVLLLVQSLRFFAALLVVMYHANIFVDHQFPQEGRAFRMMVSGGGRSGVHIFFVISGFIMMYTNYGVFGQPGATLRFVRLRLIRIYPPYWIMLVAYLAGSASIWAGFPTDAPSVLGAVVLWPGLADSVISVAWTLSFEMYFYLLFSLALFLPRFLGLALLATCLVLGVLIGQVAGLQSMNPSGEALYGSELLLFLAGIGIGLAARNPRLVQAGVLGWRPVLIALTGVILLVLSPLLRARGLPPIAAYGPAAVLLVGAAVVSDLSGRSGKIAKWTAPLGESSYSLYLSHILVMTLINGPFVVLRPLIGLNVWGQMAVYMAASILVAHTFFLVVEHPLQIFLRKTVPLGLARGSARH